MSSFSSLRIALLRRGDETGIHDLARHGDVAGVSQHRVETLEQGALIAPAFVSFSRNSQIVRASGTRSESPRPQEPHEGQPVVDQELGPLVRQIVGRLDHQNLQHHHRIVRRSPTVRAARIGKRLLQLRPECSRNPPPAHTPRADHRGRSAAEAAHQHRKTPPQPPSKSPIAVNSRMESQSRRNGEVNRSVQLMNQELAFRRLSNRRFRQPSWSEARAQANEWCLSMVTTSSSQAAMDFASGNRRRCASGPGRKRRDSWKFWSG